jgi:hypothetical protein
VGGWWRSINIYAGGWRVVAFNEKSFYCRLAWAEIICRRHCTEKYLVASCYSSIRWLVYCPKNAHGNSGLEWRRLQKKSNRQSSLSLFEEKIVYHVEVLGSILVIGPKNTSETEEGEAYIGYTTNATVDLSRIWYRKQKTGANDQLPHLCQSFVFCVWRKYASLLLFLTLLSRSCVSRSGTSTRLPTRSHGRGRRVMMVVNFCFASIPDFYLETNRLTNETLRRNTATTDQNMHVKKNAGVFQSFTWCFSLPKHSCERLKHSCCDMLMWQTDCSCETLNHSCETLNHSCEMLSCSCEMLHCSCETLHCSCETLNCSCDKLKHSWRIDVHAIMRRPKRQQPTNFHSIFETNFPRCSPLCLWCVWHRERDISPSKQRHDLSERCVSSRVFLAAAMVDRSLPHGDGLSSHRSIVSPIT